METAVALRSGELALGRQFGGARLELLQTLGRSERSLVMRAAVEPGPARPSTVIVKAYEPLAGASSSVREAAALGALRSLPGGLGPDLLAVGKDPAVVVMSDLGTHLSLADLLRGQDASTAARGIEQWGQTMADLHVASARRGDDFAERLGIEAARLGAELPAVDDTEETLAWVAEALPTAASRLGVGVPAAACDELISVNQLLGGGGEANALTPADACPDNNALVPGIVARDGLDDQHLVLLDFEHAVFRHVAWDAAYLTVPWPSCWCSWLMPAAVATAALALWRARVGEEMGWVKTEGFSRDLDMTTLTWSLISVVWFLERTARPEEALVMRGPGGASPPVRDVVLHRLELAAGIDCPQLGALRTLAERMAAAAREQWGGLELAVAPAWL